MHADVHADVNADVNADVLPKNKPAFIAQLKAAGERVALVADAIDASRRTYAKIRQNLFWALFYNLVGIPLAALGYARNPRLRVL